MGEKGGVTVRQSRRLKRFLVISYAVYAVVGLAWALGRSDEVTNLVNALVLVSFPAGLVFAALTFRAGWIIWGWTGLLLTVIAGGAATWLVPGLLELFLDSHGGDTGKLLGVLAKVVLTAGWIWVLLRGIDAATEETEVAPTKHAPSP